MKDTHKRKHGRGKGCGTLERRASGVYLARWTVDGKRYTQNTHTKDKAEAAAILAKLVEPFQLKDTEARLAVIQCHMDGIRGRLAEIERNAPALKIADAWAAYLRAPDAPRLSNVRAAMFEARFRHFVDFMAQRYPEADELRKVTREQVAAFVATLAGYAPDTANSHIRICRDVWRKLESNPKAKLNGESVWDKVKYFRGKCATRRALSHDELSRVCEYVKGEMRLLFAIGIYTGLRLGDCALLTWDCVDMARRIISLVPRKTAHASGLNVVVPLHPALYAMLEETPTDARRGYLIPDTAGLYKTNAQYLTVKIQQIFKDCGIKTNEPPTDGRGKRARVIVGFHSLRHTFVSMAANAGAPLALVQSIVGHTNAEMTRHYFHASEAALKSAVALLPNVTGTATDGEAAGNADGGERWRRFVEVAAILTPQERDRARAFLDGLGVNK